MLALVSYDGRLVIRLASLGTYRVSARMSTVDAELVAALLQRVTALEQRVAELERHTSGSQA